MRTDESGQMMLLAAVVLVVAFLSLSVMVGRIATIEPQTLRETDNPLLQEAEVLRRGICVAIVAGAPVTEPVLDSALDFMEFQLAGRGFNATLEGSVAGTATTVNAELRRLSSVVAFQVVQNTGPGGRLDC